MTNTSFETLWQGEVSRRRRLIKFGGLAIALFLSLTAGVWFYVTQPLFVNPKSAEPTSVDPTRLEAHVRTISEANFPHDFEHTEALERVASYLREQFEKAHGAVSDQPFQVNGRTYRNVIARFGPETDELIVVGAHYDSFGQNPAADDNATAFYRNKAYHTNQDTANRLDYQRMAMVVQQVHAAVMALSN